ncbi:hypothetical protein HDU67_003634 [Dinochytrium kinnereticum]|nr:hypothetical protein HDU67_003634 [Dinochytrium kinnereticum]
MLSDPPPSEPSNSTTINAAPPPPDTPSALIPVTTTTEPPSFTFTPSKLFTPITKRKLNKVLSAFDVSVSRGGDEELIRIGDGRVRKRLASFKMKSVYRFPITSSAVAIRATRRRLVGLMEAVTVVPVIEEGYLITKETPIYHLLRDSEMTTLTVSRTDDEVSRMMTLALYGWEKSDVSVDTLPRKEYIRCFLCNRQVAVSTGKDVEGVVMKKRRVQDDDGASDKADSSHQVSVMGKLNPFEEHRWYCPWIAEQTDGVSKGKNGYQINVDALVKGKQRQEGITPDISGHDGAFNLLKTRLFLKQHGF